MVIPLFTSHYDMDHSSVLTLEEAGKTPAGGPTSVCDIAREQGLKTVVLVSARIDGFIEAYKHIQKAGLAHLVYGVKLTLCADETDKTDASRATESSVIIFIRNTAGYSDLIRIYNRAWTTNHVGYGRTSWRELRALWTPNLALAIPFFSGFIARNALTFNSIVPDFPCAPTLFKEIDNGLPFAPIIDEAMDLFARQHGLSVQPVKTIYYRDSAAFDAYVTFRAIGNRAEFARPQVDHLCSDRFSFEAWRALAGGTA